MAQVPNYYYNSPWIADAARNLASALKPPSPQELLEARRTQLQMDILQQKADFEAQDREDANTVRAAFGRMLEPAINPVTNEVDPVQTEKNIRMDYADALRAGADPKASAGLLGTASPFFQQQEALAQLRAAEAYRRM